MDEDQRKQLSHIISGFYPNTTVAPSTSTSTSSSTVALSSDVNEHSHMQPFHEVNNAASSHFDPFQVIQAMCQFVRMSNQQSLPQHSVTYNNCIMLLNLQGNGDM